MTFLWKKHQGGKDYWYIRKTARINGKVKVVLNQSLGTADAILARFKAVSEIPEDLEIFSYEFGTVAAILSTDRELGFSKLVEDTTKSRTTALALLAFMTGRADEPLSKNAMDGWYNRSLLHVLKPNMPDLSCRSYLRYMDRLSKDDMKDITFQLAKRMVELGYKPSLVFLDTTNVSTEQEPDDDDPDRLLPRPGHAKDGNKQAKLIGIATATTSRHLPVYHETYPGNTTDVKLFQLIIEEMISQMLKLGVASEDLVFVFDKGMISTDGLALLKEPKVHFVSSLKRTHVADLMARPLESYRKLYTTEQKEYIYGFRVRRTVMGVKGTIVVTYNEAARKRQSRDYAKAKRRFLAGCKETAKSMSKKHRGRKSTVQSVTERIEDILPRKWRGVFKYHVGATLDKGFTRFTVKGWVVKDKEKELMNGFGKTTVFTDRDDWDDEKIARTYFSRSAMEEDYRVLKDVLLFPVMPIYHRIDKRILVHTFLCVMGLLFYRFIQLRAEERLKRKMPIMRLVAELKRLRVGCINQSGKKNVRFVMEKASREGNELMKALDLARFIPM